MIGEWLLCDFHIHTATSDGHVPLHEVVDLYGGTGFDVISITDHVIDAVTEDKLTRLNQRHFGVRRDAFGDYLTTLWQESRRAWEEYRMILIPGAELTNNDKDYHILAIDIKDFIDPSLSPEDIITEIHRQGGIAVACHPHHKDSDATHSTLYLWERNEQYAPLFDAWEVANRDDLFNVVGLKRVNYIANSDFHAPRHLYSWKTLIHADKNPEAVKQALRNNRRIAIHLFRKGKRISDE